MDAHAAPTHSLIHIRDSAPIQEAAQLMCDLSIGALGVNDTDQEFVGLITERDLMWAQAQGRDPAETAVKEILNDFPIVVDAPVSTEDAAKRMMSGHVRHLLVNDNDELRIVSMWDLLVAEVEASGSESSKHVASAAEMRRMFGSTFINR